VVIEEFGGDVPSVPVSAKQRIGLDDLLEVIGLVADLQDLKANPDREAYGTIIESKVEKGRGTVATVLVQTGTLRVGDIVTVGKTWGRVRALQNAAGRRVKEAAPATAVEILGLQGLPEAGDLLRVVADEKAARDAAEAVERNAAGAGAASLEDISAQIQASETKELRVILKTDVQGSLGAIRHALDALSTAETRINILSEGAGGINESDILLAAASQAVVVGFNTQLDPGAERAVEASGVDVRLYEVIYKLTDDIQLALQGLLTPKLVEQVEARLLRGGQLIVETRIDSLRRFKDDVREVATGFECGIGLAGSPEVAEGDVIECFQMVSEGSA
jgi:translation initiation factor IF-2